MTDHELERLAGLLQALPPAPAAWLRAAQELPLARRGLDEIIARAEADVRFRQALVVDAESALETAGYAADPALLDAIRERITTSRG